MINDEYQLFEKLGRGSFGSVYRAKNSQGQQFAIKKMKRHRAEQYFEQTTLREIVALRQLNGQKHIVQLFEVILTDDKIYLVFPYYQFNLHDYIKKQPIADYKSLFKMLLVGLKGIHSQGYIHRDIKPLNILMDNVGDPFIADFGMARHHYYQCRYLQSERYTFEVATLHYRPPENLLGSEDYDQRMDIWSMGCVFSQIVTGKVLFQADTQIEMLFKIFERLGTPSPYIAPYLGELELFKSQVETFPRFYPSRFLYAPEYIQKIGYAGADLIRQMLCLDPGQRLTVDEALNHIFFL